MATAQDVTDRNGMKHDDRGLFSKSSGSAARHGERGGERRDDGRGRGGDTRPRQRYDDLLSSLESIRRGFGGHYEGAHGGHGGYGGGSHAPSPFAHYEPPKPKPVFRIPNVKTDGPAKQSWRYADSKGKAHDTRVDRITDQPVSAEMEDAINRLYRGEEVPMDEIEDIPEVRNEKRLADAYCTLDEFMHPNDYENRNWTLRTVYHRFSLPTVTSETNDALKGDESYDVKQGNEIWLVTGLPGSGKSTGFVGPISKANQARVVDSDAIKERLPGYCKGLGAPNVHEQSKSINDRILAESLDRGDNIVYPILGYNADYVGDQIDSFRRKGYKVHLVLNELPFSQSLARCLERRLATGRNIPLAMFKKVGDRPSEAYERLKAKVDDYEKHTGDGLTVRLVEKGENKDLPKPRANAVPAYTYHGKPLHGIETYEHDRFGNPHFGGGGDNGHVADFAEEFNVRPQSKPRYWAKSWVDSFRKAGKPWAHDDAQDRVQDAPRDAPGETLPFVRVDLPEAFDGEIDGYETARDLARFHYVSATDCFDEE